MELTSLHGTKYTFTVHDGLTAERMGSWGLVYKILGFP